MPHGSIIALLSWKRFGASSLWYDVPYVMPWHSLHRLALSSSTGHGSHGRKSQRRNWEKCVEEGLWSRAKCGECDKASRVLK